MNFKKVAGIVFFVLLIRFLFLLELFTVKKRLSDFQKSRCYFSFHTLFKRITKFSFNHIKQTLKIFLVNKKNSFFFSKKNCKNVVRFPF